MQRGYTLIELLVAMAVSTVILSGSVGAIYAILAGSQRSNAQAVSLTDVDVAAMTIRNDLLMAQSANLSGSSATLSWYNYTSSFGTSFETYYSANYTLLPNKQLWRTFGTSANLTTSLAGRNVSSLSFTPQGIVGAGGLVSVTISSSNTTARSQPRTLSFSVHMRPETSQ